jgi:hypothetical protein
MVNSALKKALPITWRLPYALILPNSKYDDINHLNYLFLMVILAVKANPS